MDQQTIEGMAGRRGFFPRRGSAQPPTRARARLFEVVEAAFDVSGDDLGASTRGRSKIAFARQTAMYLARVGFGMTLAEAGRLFGRDRTTVAHACRCVEDRRDDPRFDALLSAMESFMLRSDSHGWSGQQ